MKKTFLTIAGLAVSLVLSFAQGPAKDYIGKYISRQGDDEYKVAVSSIPDGSLSVKGTLMGISETVLWKPVKD